jgi:uncharacterized membrane protein YqgA involved in biofilm formation
VTGAFLNALGILFGGLFGMARREPLSLRAQLLFRNLLGTATLFIGMRLVWLSVGGTFLSVLKQLFFAVLALVLGNALGRLLRLQKLSNRLGKKASVAIADAQKNPSPNTGEGLNACAILFCASPLGILGAVTDGLAGYFYFLAVKAVMDALAMTGFIKMFRWPIALSAFPVFLFLGLISYACRFHARPLLDAHHLTNSVTAAGGLMALAIALMIFEVRRVELANYLPTLIVAPFLAWLVG